VTGEGRPRLIVKKATDTWTRVNYARYTATTVSEDFGDPKAVTSSTASTDRIVTSVDHLLTAGDRYRLAGHTSTPDINGDATVANVVNATTFVMAWDITANGTGGTTTWIPGYWKVQAGMRVVAQKARGGLPNLECYARITGVNAVTGVLTVDQWVPSQPADGDTYSVNGWVIDLPYSQGIRQEFTPCQTVHSLWRKRLDNRFYGYEYGCTVDFSQWIDADTLYLMRQALNPSEDDTLVIVPYTDKPGYNYEVIFDDTMALNLFGKGGGHRDFVMKFKGKYLVPMPLLASGYGFGYSLSYGTQL